MARPSFMCRGVSITFPYSRDGKKAAPDGAAFGNYSAASGR